MKSTMKWASFCLFACIAAVPVAAQQNYFTNWPAGRSPREVGKRLAEHFVVMTHQAPTTIHYSEVGTWYGALTFAEITHDTDLRDRLIKKFEPLMPDGAEADRIPKRDHVDDSIFGIVPLEIASQTHDKKGSRLWADVR